MRPSFRIRTTVALAVGAVTVTLSSSALADDKRPAAGYTESKDQSGQVVSFVDDPLGATGLDPNIPMIGSRRPGQRTQMMRPRVNFVYEMYRAVENL